MADCRSSTGKRATDGTLDSGASSAFVKELGRLVLVENPQMKRPSRAKLQKADGGLGKQASADPPSLQIAPDVKILEERSPLRVFVQYGVGEADDLTTEFGNDRGLIRPAGIEATRPDPPTFGDNGAVEVRIQIRAAIVAAPAVGVERGDTAGIVIARRPVPHDFRRRAPFGRDTAHLAPLRRIDSGIGCIAQDPLTGWRGWPSLP